MKRYGDTNTELTLTAKAQAIYDSTSPLSIIEKQGGLYDIKGVFEAYDLTADEVNEYLESIADEFAESEEE